MRNKKRKLLVMGGTRISCEIIQKAQKMGLFVGVADYNDISESPGKQIADKAYLTDACDIDAMVKLIKEEQYDGVLCGFADVLLPYYAEICDKAGLPAYGTREQFELFINKEKYKDLCHKYDIPTVKEYDVDIDNYEDSSELIEYPVLVKPIDSSGARGITICYGSNELKNALKKAASFSRQKKCLVEKYLTGEEVTVFWVFQDGKRYLTCIGNRHVKNNQEGVIPLPVAYTYPASVTVDYIRDIEPKAQNMFEDVGIQNGMMFMQCKVENGECIVYDIGFRLTGSLEYKMLNELCNYDPLEMMIRFAITGSMGEPELGRKVNPYLNKRYGYNVSILSKPGKIAEINGCDALKNTNGVIDVVKAHIEREEITKSMKGLLSQITVRILGCADDIDSLKRYMFNVFDQIKILDEEGNNLKLPGIEDEDFDLVMRE